MPLVRRLEIDQGGMGLAMAEELAREFPDRVEGVQFTAAKKEALAVLAKRRLEEAKVRLPDDDAVRESFRSVKKSVNSLGQSRFDAEHDSTFGHADHWWAFCMAEAAASARAAIWRASAPWWASRLVAAYAMPPFSRGGFSRGGPSRPSRQGWWM